MKQIVLFGDKNSIYNIKIKEEVEKKGYIVDLIDIYKEVDLIATNKIILGIPIIIKIYKYFLCYKIISRYKIKNKKKQIAHIQYIGMHYLFLLPFFLFRFSKFILAFWGSDLLRQKKWKLRLMKPLFLYASNITFPTSDMKKKFIEIITGCENKISLVQFGLIILDKMDLVTIKDIKIIKEKFCIPDNKIVLVIGYNRTKEQQHINVIKSLVKIKNINKQLYIIIPWAYGKEEDGSKEIIEKELIKNEFEYYFINKFLTDLEIAAFRKITDILVQVQVTDGLSGSMQEVLYAGKEIITGDWLPYDFLYEKGIKMHKVSGPEDVGSKVEYILNNLHEVNKETKKNAEIISGISKWSSSINRWIELYS